MPDPTLRDLLTLATDAAYVAGRRTLAYFNAEIAVEDKADATPVTVADREAERVIRERSITASLARSDAYETLLRRVKLNRGWGDCYGYALVATGRAEIMLDSSIKPWDCAPLPPILRESGGRFTTWAGEETIWGPDGFATNAALHEEVLRLLRAEKRRPSEG